MLGKTAQIASKKTVKVLGEGLGSKRRKHPEPQRGTKRKSPQSLPLNAVQSSWDGCLEGPATSRMRQGSSFPPPPYIPSLSGSLSQHCSGAPQNLAACPNSEFDFRARATARALILSSSLDAPTPKSLPAEAATCGTSPSPPNEMANYIPIAASLTDVFSGASSDSDTQ